MLEDRQHAGASQGVLSGAGDPQGVLDSRGLGQWEKAGSPATSERLQARYEGIIGAWQPPALGPAKEQALYEIMGDAFERCGGTRDSVLRADQR